MKRIVLGFAGGFVLYGALRIILTLVGFALYFYGFTFLVELSFGTPIDWGFLLVLGLSVLPASMFVGYFCRRWGWVAAMMLEPAWTLCVFPISPIVQNLVSIASGLGPIVEGYIDWPALITYQLGVGSMLGLVGGTIGELASRRSLRSEEFMDEQSDNKLDDRYFSIEGLGDIFGWYFRRSATILIRLPILLIFGGGTIVLLISNVPFILMHTFGLSTFDRSTGAVVSYGALDWAIFLAELFFVAAPAIVIPYLWSSSLPSNFSPSRSIRLALSAVRHDIVYR